MKRRIVAVCSVLMLVDSAAAWNYPGHRAIAFLAYSCLTTKTKQRVDAILRAHPDYASILTKGDSNQPWDVARNAFVTAATWPDIIRGDDRFSDDGKLPPAPGFSDSGRHGDWHYINTPWPLEFRNQPVPPVNALAQFRALLKQLKRSAPADASAAYAFTWFLHLGGDLHQPLHAMTRFADRGGKPDNDRGGNWCYVEPGRNLHAFWDGILGRDHSEKGVARLAASLMDQTPRPEKLDTNPDTWIREALAIAPQVYAFGDCPEKGAPITLSVEYREKAEQLARVRAALAGYRLAKILNERL